MKGLKRGVDEHGRRRRMIVYCVLCVLCRYCQSARRRVWPELGFVGLRSDSGSLLTSSTSTYLGTVGTHPCPFELR